MKVYNSGMSGGIVSSDAGKSTVSKDGFLKLLAAQLQNQDPMNTGDNTEYVAQMAQFTSLEQISNLNKTMENLLLSQKFQQGSIMIGKTAKIAAGEEYITGKVSGVKLIGGAVKITVEESEYSIDDVVELSEKGSGEVVV